MRFEYKQTREDVRAATRLMTWKLKYFFIGGWLLVLMIGLPSLRESFGSGESASGETGKIVALVPLTLLAIFFLLLYQIQPRLAARKAILRSVEWNFSDAGVHLSSEVASSEMKWPAFIGLREDKRTLLLYVQKGQAQFIPKRILDESQLKELKALISTHVAKA
jgi:hypothetical protein